MVHSIPPGAEVIDGGQVLGRTPLQVIWDPESEAPELELRLTGFSTGNLSLEGRATLEHVVHLRRD